MPTANNEALARQINATMRTLHRTTTKLCELLTEATKRAEQAGHVGGDVTAEVVAPKED
jgi:methanogenic corrinoid protein MtbC1